MATITPHWYSLQTFPFHFLVQISAWTHISSLQVLNLGNFPLESLIFFSFRITGIWLRPFCPVPAVSSLRAYQRPLCFFSWTQFIFLLVPTWNSSQNVSIFSLSYKIDYSDSHSHIHASSNDFSFILFKSCSSISWDQNKAVSSMNLPYPALSPNLSLLRSYLILTVGSTSYFNKWIPPYIVPYPMRASYLWDLKLSKERPVDLFSILPTCPTQLST